jgi:predicted glycosyltransferase
LPVLRLAADHPDRVRAAVIMAGAVPLVPWFDPDADFEAVYEQPQGWQRFTRHAWLNDYPGFVEWLCGEIHSEPHSTWHVEFTRALALQTTGEVLARRMDAPAMDEAETRRCVAALRCPLVVVHGDEDRITPYEGGVELARLAGAPLVTIAGCGHAPAAREPVRVNHLLRAALLPDAPPARWVRASRRAPRALVVSSPIGLGHVHRDLAIVEELRRLRPRLEVEWLAQDPVTRVLEGRGERIHPASAELASESAHWSACAAEHSLHAFEAHRCMDEILLANYMLFDDVARDGCYDLWVGDEAWDVDYYLHENPERKTARYAWLTDFVGYVPLARGGEREAELTADYNAEMIEQVERYPRIRDAAIFVGDPEDVVPGTFGPGLPVVRDWVEAHYAFCGYVLPAEHASVDRHALRSELGLADDAPLVLCAVGGSGIGRDLLERAIAALPIARRDVPALRMLAVAGPRIDADALSAHDGLERVGFVPDLYRWLAAADVVIAQGGLTTSMEAVAAGTPLVYVPLDDHFEQQVHVRHRLERHGAGSGLAFAAASPETLAAEILSRLGGRATYREIPRGGARRAAELIAGLV